MLIKVLLVEPIGCYTCESDCPVEGASPKAPGRSPRGVRSQRSTDRGHRRPGAKALANAPALIAELQTLAEIQALIALFGKTPA